jgi:hypothetical protein
VAFYPSLDPKLHPSCCDRCFRIPVSFAEGSSKLSEFSARITLRQLELSSDPNRTLLKLKLDLRCQVPSHQSNHGKILGNLFGLRRRSHDGIGRYVALNTSNRHGAFGSNASIRRRYTPRYRDDEWTIGDDGHTSSHSVARYVSVVARSKPKRRLFHSQTTADWKDVYA